MVVDRVIAGVVVEVATVPAKPLAETTEADVTVPEPELSVVQVGVVPVPEEVSTWPTEPLPPVGSVIGELAPLNVMPPLKVAEPVWLLVLSRVTEVLNTLAIG